MPMKILGMLVLFLLVPAPGQSDCSKGTPCRDALNAGFKHCNASARARWRAVGAACKKALKEKNPGACRAAIRNARDSETPTVITGAEKASTLLTCPVDQPECGPGCCPPGFPTCGHENFCCPTGYPVDCETFCCPLELPICDTAERLCHPDTVTPTTVPPQFCPSPTSTTLPGPGNTCTHPNDFCTANHACGGFTGGCESKCDGSGFACIRTVSIYSKCKTSADCPPTDQGPGHESSTICVPSFYENDGVTFNCTAFDGMPLGNCASPCP